MSAFTDASDPFSPTSDEVNPPDVIVRSSDVVDFHAHKAILSFGSVVFKDMFSFPEPTGEDANATRDGKIIISLPEDSQTVEKLLLLCYPRFTSSYLFRHLGGIDTAYEASGKYQIPGAQNLLEQVLEDPRYLEEQPHRVFAIACHRGLEKLAKAAAMETLNMLWQPQDFHSRCSQAVGQLLGRSLLPRDDAGIDEDELPPTPVWLDCSGHSADCGPFVEEEMYVYPTKWFRDHIGRVAAASTRCPDAKSVGEVMSNTLGPTLTAISNCPKCVRLGPQKLKHEGVGLTYRATRVYELV
ncbi:hypothetical protein DFH09DRAFT_1435006 [Mycena vulgaris]|nr:hypothetical protein DFH09DRAFT_1435006 [Mycena vulgaris]